ncbi:aromatic amino acid transport family protein [Patescibacteria group bacterium]
MKKNTKKIIYAVSMLVGTIVGVGMFGLPYVASKVGFMPMMFYLFGGAFVSIAISLVYGEVIMESDGKKRLPGYVNDYFGKKWGAVILINFLIAMYGSLLAYIIVGGSFLHGILSQFIPISLFLSTVIFFTFSSYLVYKGVKSIKQTEFLMLIVLLLVVFIFFFMSLGTINVVYFSGYDLSNIFLPYGVVIFSFMGISILPEIKEIFIKGKDEEKYSEKGKKNFKRAVCYSILIALFIYIIFVITVFGVSGGSTSMEAFSGLEPFMSNKIIFIGYIFGLLAVFTSYISIGLTVKKCLWYDYKINPKFASVLSCGIPFLLFLAGFKNFINIIGFVGTITFGIAGSAIFILYFKVKKMGKIEKSVITNYTAYMLIIMFWIGIFLALKG